MAGARPKGPSFRRVCDHSGRDNDDFCFKRAAKLVQTGRTAGDGDHEDDVSHVDLAIVCRGGDKQRNTLARPFVTVYRGILLYTVTVTTYDGIARMENLLIVIILLLR